MRQDGPTPKLVSIYFLVNTELWKQCAHQKVFEWTKECEKKWGNPKEISKRWIGLNAFDPSKQVHLSELAGVEIILFQFKNEINHGEGIGIITPKMMSVKSTKICYIS